MIRLKNALAHFFVLVCPLSPDEPTCSYLGALRSFLDISWPGWREQVFTEVPRRTHAIEVEFPLPDGRVICGTLIQRPSLMQCCPHSPHPH